MLTEIGLETGRIELGTGIVNIYGRSPATLAQAAASLSELLDGRAFNLGLGTSSRAVVEGLHGLPFERPFQRMAEALRLIRLALAGQRLELRGEVFRTGGFRLGVVPRGPVRLFVAGLARPMLAVTGRYADGWLPNLPSRRGFPALRDEVAAAAAQAERPMPTTAAYLYTMLGDEADAEASLRRTIAWYLASGGAGYRSLFRRYGYGDLVDQVAASWAQGRRTEARALVTTELIRDVCLVGPARTIPERRRLCRAARIASRLQALGAGRPRPFRARDAPSRSRWRWMDLALPARSRSPDFPRQRRSDNLAAPSQSASPALSDRRRHPRGRLAGAGPSDRGAGQGSGIALCHDPGHHPFPANRAARRNPAGDGKFPFGDNQLSLDTEAMRGRLNGLA